MMWIPIIVGDVPWPPTNIGASIMAAIEWLTDLVFTGFIDLLGALYVVGIRSFIIVDNPYDIQTLNTYWSDLVPYYPATLFFLSFFWFVTNAVVADRETSLKEFIGRVLVSVIILFSIRGVMAVGIDLTNAIVLHLLPEQYAFQSAETMIGQAIEVVEGPIVQAIIGLLIGLPMLIGSVITLIALDMRELFIHTSYSLSPVYSAFYSFRTGPLKYFHFIAQFMIRGFAIILLGGMVIAAILGVGAAAGSGIDQIAADPMGGSATTTPDGVIETTALAPGSMDVAPSEQPVGGAAQSGNSYFLLRYFMWVGSLWLASAVTLSFFGMIFIASSSTPGGAGGFSGRPRSAGGQARGAAAGHYGIRQGEHSRGTAHAFSGEEGQHAILNPGGGGVIISPTGEVTQSTPQDTTFRESNIMTPFDADVDVYATEGTPLTEKAARLPGVQRLAHLSQGSGWASWLPDHTPADVYAPTERPETPEWMMRNIRRSALFDRYPDDEVPEPHIAQGYSAFTLGEINDLETYQFGPSRSKTELRNAADQQSMVTTAPQGGEIKFTGQKVVSSPTEDYQTNANATIDEDLDRLTDQSTRVEVDSQIVTSHDGDDKIGTFDVVDRTSDNRATGDDGKTKLTGLADEGDINYSDRMYRVTNLEYEHDADLDEAGRSNVDALAVTDESQIVPLPKKQDWITDVSYRDDIGGDTSAALRYGNRRKGISAIRDRI